MIIEFVYSLRIIAYDLNVNQILKHIELCALKTIIIQKFDEDFKLRLMDSVILACYNKKCSKFRQKINQQSHIYDFSRFRKHAKKGQCISYDISFYFNPSFSA